MTAGGDRLGCAPTIERSDARESQEDTPRMRHLRSFDPARRLCGGLTRNPHTVVWGGPVECVVCASLWQAMPYAQKRALIIFWGGSA